MDLHNFDFLYFDPVISIFLWYNICFSANLLTLGKIWLHFVWKVLWALEVVDFFKCWGKILITYWYTFLGKEELEAVPDKKWI